ncbi:hypothetical protein H2200_013613 [Cladophialophora chaetospira]|uniref:Ubiquitin-like protease family profile domain-containing protein n=1 Tax=Cladophialophora chaetospira TaxID=386627 RepID=A0AA38U4G7_9EURO|nr:hypothetical protein H2200_013613 [Cladophialophora chaetospira]
MAGLSFQDLSPWSHEEISRGFRKRVVGEPLPSLAPLDVSTVGQHRRQWIVREGNVVRGTTDVLSVEDSVAVVPSLSAKDPLTLSRASSDMTLTEALEKTLAQYAATEKKQMDYFILNDLAPQTRSELGLPDTVPISDDALAQIRQHARDLQPRLICRSNGESFDFLQKSNADLQSATVLWRGHDIVWLVVSPRHSFILEARLNDHLGLEQQCSQYIRHEEVIIPPSTLESWKIDFSVFVQVPGEMVTTDYQAYHYAWKLGANLTETMILYDSVWVWPPKYVDCKEGNWKCEMSRSLIGTVSQSVANFSPSPLEILPTEQMTNHGVGSFSGWDHQTVEVFGDKRPGGNTQPPSVIDFCSPPREDPEEDAPKTPYFWPTAESDISSRGTSAEAEVQTIPSDGLQDGKRLTPSSVSTFEVRHETNSLAEINNRQDPSNIGGLGSLNLHDNASESGGSSQNLFFNSPTKGAASISTSQSAVSRESSPGHVISRPNVAILRPHPPLRPVVASPEVPDDASNGDMTSSSVKPDDGNSTAEEHNDDDPQDHHRNESPATEPFTLEPEIDSSAPADFNENSQSQETLSNSNIGPQPSLQSDILTLSDSPSSEPQRLEREDTPIMLTPERAVRLRRLDSSIAARQRAKDLEDLVQLGTQYQNQIVWKTVRSEDAERTLSRFRAGEWLNDDAIMETLYRLTSGRDDVHVVHSLDFAAAYDKAEAKRIRRWTVPAIILIPVYLEHQHHWLLVSVHVGRHRLTIHDGGHRPNRRLERFLSAIFPATEGWNRDYQNTLNNDGNNCGVILLKEAEAVLTPNSAELRDFNLLRKRYLLLLLSDIMKRYDESCAITPEASEMDGNVDLHRLAAAMGCREVLEDFLEMITVVRDERGRVDSGAQRAFQMYEEAMLHDPLDTGSDNLLRNVDEALHLYSREISLIDVSRNDDSDNQPRMAREELRTVFRAYTSANGHRKLASIKQDMAAFRVARIYHALKDADQEDTGEVNRAKRRKNAPKKESNKPGPRAAGRAYEELLKEWIREEENGSKSLKEIRSRGSHLLTYDAVCGRSHPLWMLFLIRNVMYPEGSSLRVQHVHYRKLDDVQTRALVDLFQIKHPELWNVLPNVAEETARVFCGEQGNFAFLEDLLRRAESA